MIIDLDKDWFLDCDDRNVVLTERRVIQAKEEGAKGIAPKPENIGKLREVQHGFYGNIAGACQGYLNKNVAGMEGMLTATAVIAAWADMTARIEAVCKTIPKRGVAPPLTLADASEEMEAAKQAEPRMHRQTMIQTADGVVTLPSKSSEPLYALPTA
jgi:hypothetical protein